MLQQHVEPGAGVTVGCHDIFPTETTVFGILGPRVHTGLSAAVPQRSANHSRITPRDVRAAAQPKIDGLYT